jgi:RNA polymerase sigma-70 factor, ECF subfamily
LLEAPVTSIVGDPLLFVPAVLPRDTRATRGDADDFGKQCERLLPNLRRYAFRLTRDPMMAEELIQDTIVKALHKQHQFAPGTNLRAWLFTIMHNQRINALRDLSRQGVPVDLSECSAAVSGGQEENEEMRSVCDALEKLPEEVRKVALLVGYDGLRYAEIADRLGIPVGTVRSRLSRGRMLLCALTGREPRRRPAARVPMAAAGNASAHASEGHDHG